MNRLVILVSGGGTNLQAILDAFGPAGRRPDDVEVVAVVSNRAEAGGLTRARAAGVPAIVLERRVDESRVDYDARLVEAVAPHRPDLVVLAGWMRILTTTFVEAFRVINLHPALPGTFPGAHAIDEAFAAWEAGAITESGVMVHWVPDDGVDDGPVIIAEPVPFEPGDTAETFEARVHTVEHRAIVKAIEIALQTVSP